MDRSETAMQPSCKFESAVRSCVYSGEGESQCFRLGELDRQGSLLPRDSRGQTSFGAHGHGEDAPVSPCELEIARVQIDQTSKHRAVSRARFVSDLMAKGV